MCESLFFDIDQILAESEMVKVVTTIDLFNLDSLDSGSLRLCNGNDITEREIEEQINDAIIHTKSLLGIPTNSLGKRCEFSHLNDLQSNSKINVPLWLAQDLKIHDYCKIDLPLIYSESFKNIALADPAVLDLPSKSRYFYEFGMLLADKISLDNKKKDKPFDFVAQVFFERVKILLNLILHLRDNTDHPFLTKLTDLEVGYFNKGMETVTQFGSQAQIRKLANRQKHLMNARKQLKLS